MRYMKLNKKMTALMVGTATLACLSIAEPVKAQEVQNTQTQEVKVEKDADVTPQEYENNVSEFTRLNMAQVKGLISKRDNKEYLLYIGRPSCYYCREFSLALKEFNQLAGRKLLYFDIDKEVTAHDYVFNELGIPGTPFFMRIKNGTIIRAWVGGGVKATELFNFIYA